MKVKEFSVLFLLIIFVVIFQNCSQVRFIQSNSKITDNNIPPSYNDSFESDNEKRCKSYLQAPQIINAVSLQNKFFSFFVGAGEGSGDSTSTEEEVVVNDSLGISPAVTPEDNCSYSTKLIVETVDPRKDLTNRLDSFLSTGIDFTGKAIFLPITPTEIYNKIINEGKIIKTNFENKDDMYSPIRKSIKISFSGNEKKTIRCATGSANFKLRINVATLYFKINVNKISEPVYLKVNFSDGCR